MADSLVLAYTSKAESVEESEDAVEDVSGDGVLVAAFAYSCGEVREQEATLEPTAMPALERVAGGGVRC